MIRIASDFARTFKLRTLFTRAARAGIAASLAWLAIWLLRGDSVPYLGYVNAGAYLIELALIPAIAICLWGRHWLWAAGGAGLLGFLIWTCSGLNIGAGEGPKAPGALRVVSASLRSTNPDMAAAAVRVAGYDPDIVILQEADDIPAFARALEAATGTKWQFGAERSYAALARFPVAHVSPSERDWSEFTIALPSGPLTVWNVHAPKSYALPTENASYFLALREAVVERHPDLLAGDFNASPFNYGYRAIDGLMRNAHRIAGFGPGNSFPGGWRRSSLFGAYVRIDHIFAHPAIEIDNAFVGAASPGADHKPIVADIRLPRG